MNHSRQDSNDTHDVFISYSRKDREFVCRLETALEGYKPPKDLNAPIEISLFFVTRQTSPVWNITSPSKGIFAIRPK